MITKEAKNKNEERILAYLQANASETLTAKINSGSKTLAGAMKYAKAEAQKLDHSNGCVVVEDDVVFGWIVHFFEEDSIKETASTAPKMPAGVKTRPVAPVATTKKVEPQLDMFTMVGGVQPKPEPVVVEPEIEPEKEDTDETSDEAGEPDPF